MPTKHKIKAGDAVRDIRSGMSDSQLMDKYGLSAKGLRRSFDMLIEGNAITLDDLYAPSPPVHDTVFVETIRELPRHYLAIAVDIYEVKRPEIKDILSNVTEKGLGIIGMSAGIGEIKTLVIPAGDFIESDPILLEAQCRWAEEEKDTGEWLAGFKITRISDKSLDDLRRLILALPFLDSRESRELPEG